MFYVGISLLRNGFQGKFLEVAGKLFTEKDNRKG